MAAQTQDTIPASEKEQLSAPPGWTKKLVPASAKSITLRKYDVIFIAPDGQELKSKWHLTRYLKSHPESPAISEFDWNSGEEAPIRRSSRFATKEASEDNKSISRKKGKRDAAEMEDDQEKAPSRKRAKKAEKSKVSDEEQATEEVEADVAEKDEVMHEAIASDNNEATLDPVPSDELQKNEDADANIAEAVIDKAMDEGLDEQVKVDDSVEEQKPMDEGLDEQVKADDLVGEQEDVQAKEGVLETLVVEEKTTVSSSANIVVEEKTTVSSANIVGEHEEIQVTVVEETKSISDIGENTEDKAAQETGTFVAPAEDLEVPEAVIETTVFESVGLLDEKLAENEGEVSGKVTAVTSVVEGFSEEEPLGPLVQQEEEPLETLTQKEEPVEPLMQKEDKVEPFTQNNEQGRPTHIQNSPQHIKDKGPSEFSTSPVPLGVANHQ